MQTTSPVRISRSRCRRLPSRHQAISRLSIDERGIDPGRRPRGLCMPQPAAACGFRRLPGRLPGLPGGFRGFRGQSPISAPAPHHHPITPPSPHHQIIFARRHGLRHVIARCARRTSLGLRLIFARRPAKRRTNRDIPGALARPTGSPAANAAGQDGQDADVPSCLSWPTPPMLLCEVARYVAREQLRLRRPGASLLSTFLPVRQSTYRIGNALHRRRLSFTARTAGSSIVPHL